MKSSILACGALGVLLIGTASAQTDEIQVYDASIAPPGVFNLTLHDNYTPIGRTTAADPGGIVPEHTVNGVPEWAYGVADWFEAGLYLPLYSISATGATTYDGFKVRALFVTPDAADRRLFYGVNLEFSRNAAHWDPRPNTQEIRTIVGWHLGRYDLIVNPILDNAYRGFSRLDFAPAARAAYHVDPAWTVALEQYDDFGPLRTPYSRAHQQHQLFGVFDHGGKPWSVEGGMGIGLTGSTDRLVLKLILERDLN